MVFGLLAHSRIFTTVGNKLVFAFRLGMFPLPMTMTGYSWFCIGQAECTILLDSKCFTWLGRAASRRPPMALSNIHYSRLFYQESYDTLLARWLGGYQTSFLESRFRELHGVWCLSIGWAWDKSAGLRGIHECEICLGLFGMSNKYLLHESGSG